MQTSELTGLFERKNLIRHIAVIGIFLILTSILTFPIIVDFGNQAAGNGCYDKCHMMWRFWWNEYSNQNNLDFTHTTYQFYPDGVNVSGNIAYFTTAISSLLLNSLGYAGTWNTILFIGFIFGGYGAYLLSNHFTKNFYSSIIAGIIFTFGSYHMAQANSHIGLSMIVWIPIFILFLFKILNKDSLFYAILGGIFFFLVSSTHLYYTVFICIFSIIFFLVYIFKEKNIKNTTFTKNFLIIFGIGLISTLVLVSPTMLTDINTHDRNISEHQKFAISLDNLISPGPFHSTEKLSDYYLEKTFFYAFHDDSSTLPYSSIEHFVFLGYTTIILSLITIIKFRPNYTWFWVLICTVFTILSLGPELKFFNTPTGIMMPERLLYEIPGGDDFRAPARFMVITFLGIAMLASFAIHNLMKNYFSGNKKQYILVTAIAVVILFEYSTIPYPANSETIPDVYHMIKNDADTRAILEAPMGGTGDFLLMSDPTILYYQTVHEKPIYGGHESRPSLDALKSTQTYFLNMFQLEGTKNDIIKQDLKTHGTQILNYYDIDYVIIHKEIGDTSIELPRIQQYIELKFYPETVMLMEEILGTNSAFYEDEKLIAYKIPNDDFNQPFLLLGSGWHQVLPTSQNRLTEPNFEILIINPQNDYVKTGLSIEIESIHAPKNTKISLNNEIITNIEITTESNDLNLDNITLIPGKNVITFDTSQYQIWKEPTFGIDFEMSYQVSSIILQ